MKATGIVRRIDDLGRVVIPKEIRRTLRIREGDPLEIYTDIDGEVIFKKYSPVGEMSSFASQYAEVLYKTSSYPVLICDRDHVIAAAGVSKKEYLERRITTALEDMMESRQNFSFTQGGQNLIPIEGVDKQAIIACPILSSGDIIGSVGMLANYSNSAPSETETKLVQTAAIFLGKQMEE